MSGFLGTAVIALAASWIFADPAEARRGDDSRAKIDALIDEFAIDRSRIASVNVISNNEGGEAPGGTYAGWITFNDCSGNLVIQLTASSTV